MYARASSRRSPFQLCFKGLTLRDCNFWAAIIPSALHIPQIQYPYLFESIARDVFFPHVEHVGNKEQKIFEVSVVARTVTKVSTVVHMYSRHLAIVNQEPKFRAKVSRKSGNSPHEELTVRLGIVIWQNVALSRDTNRHGRLPGVHTIPSPNHVASCVSDSPMSCSRRELVVAMAPSDDGPYTLGCRCGCAQHNTSTAFQLLRPRARIARRRDKG